MVYLRVAGEASESPPPFCLTQFCPRAVHVLRCLSLFSHLRKDFHRHWRSGSRPPSLLTRPSLGQRCLLGHFRGFLKAPAVTQQTPVMPQPCPQTFTGTGLSRGKVTRCFVIFDSIKT